DLGNIDVKKWDGSSWQVIGDSSKIGSQDPKDFNFTVNGSTPYLSYSTFDSSSNYGSATVSKYDSAEGWINIGVDLSPGLSYKTNLAFDSKGDPYISYVAYMGEGVFYKHIIKKLNDENWEILREYEGSEVGPSYHNDFIIDSNDNIYLAYIDYSTSREVTVERHNGTSWNVIGTKGFTDDGNDNGVHAIDLELDSNDNPILAVDHNSYSMGQEGKYAYKYLTGVDKWIPLRSEFFKANLDDLNFDTYQNKAYLIYSTYDGLDHGHLLEYLPTEGYTPPPSPSPRPSIPKLVIETDELPDGIEGEEYEFQLEGDGGREPYTWDAEGLPEGLEISEDGEILGTPEEAGTFNVKIELLDSRSYFRSKTLKLFIEEKEEEPVEVEEEFTDVRGHWFIDFLRDIFDRSIIFGYPDRTFRPNNKVTRGEFASMIIRTFDIDPIEGNLFDDTVDNWAESSINGAVGRGIITGYEDNTFRPNAPITREEMAAMISRALNLEEEVVEDYFEDIGTASPWAQLSIRRLGNSKIITGFPDGTFRPKDTLTRAEAVKVIYEILEDLDELQ
ncbi:MAG: S-layer homology domain-containing protein, partial [Tissierellales bacterium]|nr:S-layer homology domain-containing protein [Tissierellales bacterium]